MNGAPAAARHHSPPRVGRNRFTHRISDTPNAIKNCLKPGAGIRKIKKADGFKAGDRLAVPDFLLSIGDKFKVLEVKTKLPTSRIPESLDRAAKQLRSAIEKKYDVGLLTKTKHRDTTFTARKDQIERLLSGPPGIATFLNGTLSVVGFIAEFVVEECVADQLGL